MLLLEPRVGLKGENPRRLLGQNLKRCDELVIIELASSLFFQKMI